MIRYCALTSIFRADLGDGLVARREMRAVLWFSGLPLDRGESSAPGALWLESGVFARGTGRSDGHYTGVSA